MDVEFYVKAVSESSARCRRIVYSLLVASIVLVIPFWNARPGNWNRERAECCRRSCECVWMKMQAESNPAVKEGYRRELARMEATGKALDEAFVAPIVIQPFGVAVDLNDLNLLGGLGLVAMLIALRSSLGRELVNLRYTFKQAGHDKQKLEEVYGLLSLGQVLTVPRQHEARNERRWNTFNKALFFAPVVAHAFCLAVNFVTRNAGFAASPFNTCLQLCGGVVLLVLIVWLTAVCCLTSRDYDLEWSTKADEIGIP